MWEEHEPSHLVAARAQTIALRRRCGFLHGHATSQNHRRSSAINDRGAQNACYSYGLQPRTAPYDRCEAAVPAYPPYRTDQYGYRVDAQGYRVDANGYHISQAPTVAPSHPVATYTPAPAYAPAYVEPRPATTGQVAFRDEFGFRYDAEGNRIDARGNIISPQTRTP